jgi:phosphotransferase system enzyme I (PtsP)
LERSRDLKGRADFISIGTNDLMQYFFAADRGNPRVSDRYDILSPPALRLLKRIRDDADAAGLQDLDLRRGGGASVWKRWRSPRLGYRRLSMPASGIGPVKRLILVARRAQARRRLQR